MRAGLTTLVLAAVIGAVAPATAGDVPLPGRKLDMKSAKTVLVARTALPAFPVKGGADDPGRDGGVLQIVAQSGESAHLELPASGWKANGAGSVFKFSGSVVRVTLKRGAFKVTAKTSGISLGEPKQDGIGLVLTVGSIRYCVFFGGQIKKDQPGRFKA